MVQETSRCDCCTMNPTAWSCQSVRQCSRAACMRGGRRGLAHEFFVRVAQTYNATSTEPLYYLEPHVAENVFYTMLREAGVTVLRHGYIESTARTDADGNSDATRAWGASPKITAVTMANGVTLGGSSTVYIDGTYEGDLMARARVSYTYGREPISLYNESYAGRREPWAEGQAHTGGKSGDYAAINPLLPNSTLPAWHPLVTELYAAPFGSGDDKVQGYNFRSGSIRIGVPLLLPTCYVSLDGCAD
jgi:hypothetical protein